MIGVDEAGFGPVIGSMFVCSVKVDDLGCLPDGIDDSKNLSNEEIYGLAEEIYESDTEVCVIEVSANDFDNAKNVNELLKERHASCIDAVSQNCEKVIVDACSEDEEGYLNNNCEFKNKDLDIKAVHKADSNYKIVGAASIIAKYSREQHISEINSMYKSNIGSGYTNDNTTIEFLKNYYEKNNGFPDFIRETWSTCSNIKQSSLKEY